ncbi:MAG: putative DNA binding domain-containing protein [Coriobacteriales bacterium]|jgi:predicted HTH transcriptional regulator|nr:putative DNA binding domain-containing protein [Coriobacteriales bacterium]
MLTVAHTQPEPTETIIFANITDLQLEERLHFEAKAALGGVPNSTWETYSAFANTDGGTICLGAAEDKRKNVYIEGVENPAKTIKEFWDIINNQNKVSCNVLPPGNVWRDEVDGKQVVFVKVPRADRLLRPIHIGSNMFVGTYRRNGEGDYRCTPEEVRAILRDASAEPLDNFMLPEFDLEDISMDTVHGYRNLMQSVNPEHIWAKLPDEEFLCRIGAAEKGKSDGVVRPTRAGLLFFGFEYRITHEFPQYFLDYREDLNPAVRWTDRAVSSSGRWSGNLFDFFMKVVNRLDDAIKKPFRLAENNITRIDDTPAHKAMREAITNCLAHADHFGREGIVIVRHKNRITLANPGILRISMEMALEGGHSDPRNPTIMKMLSLLDPLGVWGSLTSTDPMRCDETYLVAVPAAVCQGLSHHGE